MFKFLEHKNIYIYGQKLLIYNLETVCSLSVILLLIFIVIPPPKKIFVLCDLYPTLKPITKTNERANYYLPKG